MTEFTEEEKELIDDLASSGFDRDALKLLMLLAHEEEPMAMDIQEELRFRSPQVSRAACELIERGWVARQKKEGCGTGRKPLAYSLAKDFGEICDDIEDELQKQIDEVKARNQKMRELSRSI